MRTTTIMIIIRTYLKEGVFVRRGRLGYDLEATLPGVGESDIGIHTIR